MEKRNDQKTSGILLGGVLILLGIIFLFGQLLGDLFRINLGNLFWPFFIIVPGVVLLGLAMAAEANAGEALSILGGMVTMTGLLLFFQNITGLWATWAYAWALIVPTAAGLGLMLYGFLRGQPEKLKTGTRLASIGAVIFLVGGAFFELLIGISGFGLGRFGWPILLIGLGVIGLVRGLLPRNR